MTEMYLVLIETSGNQNYIFSTNRLRENIGASELTYQAGTYWVGDAVDNQNQKSSFKNYHSPKEFRDALKRQVALEDTEQKAEIILAASGKALILTKNEDTAKGIISGVTRRALIDAPGLDIAGVYEPFTWSETKPNSLTQAIKAVHRRFEEYRSCHPSSENRFLRLPIVASCAVSGLPASQVGKDPNGSSQSISQASYVKRQIAQKGIERLQEIAKPHPLAKDINKLEKKFGSEDMSWVAIVHADGNGLGQIFLNFQNYIGQNQTTRGYINKYRRFSLTLEECTEEAFREALKEVLPKNQEFLPIVPLIIGGDDLTVVCHGQYALEFTRVFLQEFEKQTEKKQEISDIAQQAFGVGRLSACAGIAIIKRHFPFSIAYQLAEKLIKAAKDIKKRVTKQGDKNTPFPCSAIDFHILYDSRGVDLEDIREHLKPEPNTYLYNRPYVVSSDLSEAEGQDWAVLHQWESLSSRIKELNSAVLPSSQIHTLRTALFLGRKEADSQLQLIQHRYENFSQFIEPENSASLFHKTLEGGYATSFLDALDAMDFLKNNQTEQSQSTEQAA